jgi:hypothetical protein
LRRLAIKTKEFEEGVDVGFAIKDSPYVDVIGGNLLLFNVVCVDNITSKFYTSHVPIQTKINAHIGCVMSLKWSHVDKMLPNWLFFVHLKGRPNVLSQQRF